MSENQDRTAGDMPTIEVRGLCKRFGHVVAVDGLSFTIVPGKITGFFGPNGSGKTTTLRMILGLVRPTSGITLVDGVPYAQLPHPKRAVGAVLETSGFYPSRSARDHLRVLCAMSGIDYSRVDAVLAMVGLAEVASRRAGGFSLGMRQRLELASALLGDPGALILDEPANGLDPQGIAWLRGFLRWYASQGRSVLVSSHLLTEGAQIVDDVVIVANGRLLARSTVAELTASLPTYVRIRTPEAERLANLLASAGIRVSYEAYDVVLAAGTNTSVVGPIIASHGLVVEQMSSVGGTLEDAFLALTGGGAWPAQVPGQWAPQPAQPGQWGPQPAQPGQWGPQGAQPGQWGPQGAQPGQWGPQGAQPGQPGQWGPGGGGTRADSDGGSQAGEWYQPR